MLGYCADSVRGNVAVAIIKIIAVNEQGQRIGESHPRAKLTDKDVEMIRTLRAIGLCYQAIADKFEITKWQVGRICRYELRAQRPDRWKEVHLPE